MRDARIQLRPVRRAVETRRFGNKFRPRALHDAFPRVFSLSRGYLRNFAWETTSTTQSSTITFRFCQTIINKLLINNEKKKANKDLVVVSRSKRRTVSMKFLEFLDEGIKGGITNKQQTNIILLDFFR